MTFLKKIFFVKEDILSKSSYEVLFKTLYAPLCRVVFKIVKEKELAEDIVQEVFIKLWEKKEELTIETSLKSYLYRAAINTSYNHLQKNKRYPMLAIENMEIDDSVSISDKVEAKELEEKINQTLLLLPDACREVFVLSRWEGLSYKEIAETLDISVKTVENQMGKALKIFREQLHNYRK